MRPFSTGLAALFAILAIASPSAAEDPGVAADRERAQAIAFVKSRGVDVSAADARDSGLWVVDVAAGEGEPAARDARVDAHVTGWLANGEKFWSTDDTGQPMRNYAFGSRSVAGFAEGVTGMRAGGHRYLVIPGNLGYGPRGNERAGIPGNAFLVFEVRVITVHP